MWALKNGDLDEVKDYVAKVSGDEWSAREHGGGMQMRLRKLMGAGLAGVAGGGGGGDGLDGGGTEERRESGSV